MYAVIRAGGKQYKVAPGDIIRIEKTPSEKGRVEFTDVLAVANDGQISRPAEGRVLGEVVEEGRADKILVFHFKRKKQYKRLRGHRQPFTAVRITEIAADGQRFTAPEETKRKAPRERAPGLERGDYFPSAADFGARGAQKQQGQGKGVVQVESQAGRKAGAAKRTAGAKSQATRAAKGGAEKKAKGPAAKSKKRKP
ncbi:MAG TPA: 50S ribosomal protein L21 [Terriglobales bacterium]|nr:50S ribosomal protein L21 [Terriglobales bacterium]